MATVNWVVRKSTIKGSKLRVILQQCINNIEAIRTQRINKARLGVQKSYQDRHDRWVRWFGWTKLVTPRVISMEEALKREMDNLDMFQHPKDAYAALYGIQELRKLQELLTAAKHFNAVTLTSAEWELIDLWRYKGEKGD